MNEESFCCNKSTIIQWFPASKFLVLSSEHGVLSWTRRNFGVTKHKHLVASCFEFLVFSSKHGVLSKAMILEQDVDALVYRRVLLCELEVASLKDSLG